MTIAAMESAIVNRLKDKCGDLVDRVYTAAEIAQIEEQSQTAPSITVMFNGLRPQTAIAGGAVQAVTFSWMVVVSIKNSLSTARSTGARADASQIIDSIIEALINFRAYDHAGSILRLAEGSAPSFSEVGFAYYPIGFEITRTYRGIA